MGSSETRSGSVDVLADTPADALADAPADAPSDTPADAIVLLGLGPGGDIYQRLGLARSQDNKSIVNFNFK